MTTKKVLQRCNNDQLSALVVIRSGQSFPQWSILRIQSRISDVQSWTQSFIFNVQSSSFYHECFLLIIIASDYDERFDEKWETTSQNAIMQNRNVLWLAYNIIRFSRSIDVEQDKNPLLREKKRVQAQTIWPWHQS